MCEDYSIVVKTFFRHDKLRRCLEHICKLDYMPKKTVVVDDSKITERKEDMYRSFSSKLELEVVNLPFDVGGARGRNEGLKKTKTDYVMVLDDDIYLSTELTPLIKILNQNPHIGGATGLLDNHGQAKWRGRDLEESCGYVVRDNPESPVKSVNTVEFRVCNEIPTPAMYRKECLSDYSWDERFKIGGAHFDFSWTHYKLGKWEFAETSDVILTHDPGGDEEYSQYRDRGNKFVKRACEKHDIDGYFNIYPPSNSFFSSSFRRIRNVLPKSLAVALGIAVCESTGRKTF